MKEKTITCAFCKEVVTFVDENSIFVIPKDGPRLLKEYCSNVCRAGAIIVDVIGEDLLVR